MKYIIAFLILTTNIFAEDYKFEKINDYHHSNYKLVISKKYNINLTGTFINENLLLKAYSVLRWEF